jgi:hypothetical protein
MPRNSNKTLGINDLAKLMKLEPATVRGNLRKKKIKKAGRAYAWKTQEEMKSVQKRLMA